MDIKSPMAPMLSKLICKSSWCHFLSQIRNLKKIPLFLFKVEKKCVRKACHHDSVGMLAITIFLHHAHDKSIAVARKVVVNSSLFLLFLQIFTNSPFFLLWIFFSFSTYLLCFFSLFHLFFRNCSQILHNDRVLSVYHP